MRAIWLATGILSIVVSNRGQERSIVGDFTGSPTEHIIIELQHPIVVRAVRGVVRDPTGAPLANVLIEIQGPGNNRRVKRVTTDGHGRFKMGHVAAGTYKVKTTLNGFQSVMGKITVFKNAGEQDEIRIDMPAGV